MREKCLLGNGKNKLSDCIDVDAAALARLQNASVLFFGDSTAYRMLENVCGAFGKKMRTTLSFPTVNRSSPYFHRRYKDTNHKHDHHYCKLLHDKDAPDGPDADVPLGLPLGVHTHYGIAGEPYWAHAYPRPPWLGRTTEAMAVDDLPAFCAQTHGCQPTLIVVNSAYWDISAWWLHAGNETQTRGSNGRSRAITCQKAPNTLPVQIGPRQVHLYVEGLRRTVSALRHAFPTSTLAWRTAHPGIGHGISAAATQTLNQAIVAHAPELGLRVIEVGNMVSQLTPRSYLLGPPLDASGRPRKGTKLAGQFVGGTTDGRHLHAYLDAEVFNLVLTELGRAWDEQSAATRYPACRTPKPTELTTRRGDETAPGRACATHAFYRAVASAELYAPVPAGDCPSSGCSTANCLCKKHDTECLSV